MPTPLPPITAVTTIDQVVDAIQGVIAWSIANESRLGYFAALYKRITIAIRAAIAQNLFQNGPRMELFDVTFASRYFAALNGYFHPGEFPPPSHCWRVAFDGASHPDPIIVQHMLAGVNAHIDLDLGIAVEQVAPGSALATIKTDFDTVNSVLASQVTGVVDEIDDLSPVLSDIYDVLKNDEIDLIGDALLLFRDGAWEFATLLDVEPGFAHAPTIMIRDLEVAKFGTLIFYPPTLLASMIAVIAAKESRDIVHNIEVLDAIASTPAPFKLTT
ncbi:MAG: hypothetical protein QOK37_2229 [Thermoanaerobaculia bacterium]|jgi:hypothetical protein|nr:hypothetical protein [Thermoanaerobaculia bacterium]